MNLQTCAFIERLIKIGVSVVKYFLLIVLFLFFSIVCVKTFKKDTSLDSLKNFTICLSCGIAAIVFLVVSICETVSLIEIYTKIDANIASWKQQYEAIVYQLENNMYQDNNIGLRDLMDRVENWNSDLASRKELEDNFWVGIYYPDVYDQFEFIDLSDYELEVEQCQE